MGRPAAELQLTADRVLHRPPPFSKAGAKARVGAGISLEARRGAVCHYG